MRLCFSEFEIPRIKGCLEFLKSELREGECVRAWIWALMIERRPWDCERKMDFGL
jgi:hypothetical protein